MSRRRLSQVAAQEQSGIRRFHKEASESKMIKKSGNETSSERILYCVKGYIYLTATVIGFIGLFLLYTVWATRNSDDWWLRWRDPFLGFSNRTMLLLAGILHLGTSVFLFATRDLMSRTLAALWMGLNHLVYYVGIALMEPYSRQYTEDFLGWRLRISPAAVDVRWKIFQAYLILASAVFLVLIWRRSRRLGNETRFKRWLEARSKPFEQKPGASKKAEAIEAYAKIVCPRCGGKIAFPLSRLGEDIPCPHCACTITLRDPSASTEC